MNEGLIFAVLTFIIAFGNMIIDQAKRRSRRTELSIKQQEAFMRVAQQAIDDVAVFRTQLETLQTQYTDMTTRYSEQVTQYAQAQSEIVVLRTENTSLREELDVVRTELSQSKKTIESLQGEQLLARNTITGLQRRVAELEAINQHVQ